MTDKERQAFDDYVVNRYGTGCPEPGDPYMQNIEEDAFAAGLAVNAKRVEELEDLKALLRPLIQLIANKATINPMGHRWVSMCFPDRIQHFAFASDYFSQLVMASRPHGEAASTETQRKKIP